MLGAMTFLPSFFQYVEGVTATQSGFRMLPLVLGLLITAITSGNIVSKTGRYKIFPVAGGLVMALGLFLLSTMDPSTSGRRCRRSTSSCSAWASGCRMQVLTIIVQSSVPYGDLGVATSGRDLLPHHGQRLRCRHLRHALRQLPQRPAARRHRREPRGHPGRPRRRRAPCTPSTTAVIAPIVNAYSESLTQVFLWAVPVALARLRARALPAAGQARRQPRRRRPTTSAAASAHPSRSRTTRCSAGGSRTCSTASAATWCSTCSATTSRGPRRGPDLGARPGARPDGRRTAGPTSPRSPTPGHLPAAILEPVFADLIVDGYAEGIAPRPRADCRRVTRAIAVLRVTAARLDHRAPRGRGARAPEAVSAAISRVVRRLVIEQVGRKSGRRPLPSGEA